MAYEFNGTNQYLNTTTAPVVDEPLTMAAWFNVNNITVSNVLVSVCSNTAVSFHVLQANGTFTGDPVTANTNDGTGNVQAATTAAYTANTWQHACGVFSANNNRAAYLNGGSSGTNTTSRAVTPTRVTIGARNSAATVGNYCAGLIAEVGIWNAALTAAEVASLAKGMTCDKVRPQSLVFYAPLVRDLIDYKGGLTITNNNTATVAAHTRVYA
jgi:hypothetical protein